MRTVSAKDAAEYPKNSEAEKRSSLGDAPVSPASIDEVRARLFATLEEPNTLTRLRRFMEFSATLDASNWETAYDGMTIETVQTGRTHSFEWRLMLQRSGELGGIRAMDRFFKGGNHLASSLVLTGWAAVEPAAARAWVEALPAGSDRQTFIGDLVDGMVQRDPAQAAALLASIPSQDRASYSGKLIDGVFQHGGTAAATAMLEQTRKKETAAGDGTERTSRAMFAALADRVLFSNWTAKTPQMACLWIGQHSTPGDLGPELLTHAAGDWARIDPVNALGWVQSLGSQLDAGTVQAGVTGVVGQWVKKDAGAVGDWLNANADQPLHDQVIYAYAGQLTKLNPAAAASWIETIQDPDFRTRARQTLNTR